MTGESKKRKMSRLENYQSTNVAGKDIIFPVEHFLILAYSKPFVYYIPHSVTMKLLDVHVSNKFLKA